MYRTVPRMTKKKIALVLLSKWVDKIGKNAAVKRLINKGVAVHTAEKLCGGRYTSTPRDLLMKTFLREMSKDGFRLPEEEAS